MQKFFFKPSLPTLPMTLTGPSQNAAKATLDLQVMATLASHVRHGPSLLGAPKVHSTGDKNEQGGGCHKQISHNEFRRFQIQGFHIELSMGVLRNCKLNSAKCRTTMTSQDHMWKLPWKKTSFTTMTTFAVHAAHLISSHAETSFPNLAAICFSPGFPGLRFPSKWLWCGSWPHQRVYEVLPPHPHQQGPPSNEACFPSSVSWSSDK